MIRCRQWICLAVAAIVFDAPAIAQQSPPEIKYHVVANTTPPDAFLSLRTDPSSSIGRRIETMPNGTALQVLKTNSDGWWYVRVVASGNEGWTLSGQKDKRWIVCCVNSPTVAASSVVPTLSEAPSTEETRSRSSGPPSPVPQPSAPVNENATSNETILQRCARLSGASPGTASAPAATELRKCIESVNTEEASHLGERACNVNVCIFRLAYVSDGTYSRSKYTLKHRASSSASAFGNQSLTSYTSILTTEDGKRTIFGETAGPSGSIFGLTPPSFRSGDIDGAFYTGPFGTGVNSYIVLAVPREYVTTEEDKKATAPSKDCQAASTTDLIPCGLKGKVVAYRFEVVAPPSIIQGRQIENHGRELGKIVFGNTDDVYVFGAIAGDRVGEFGFVYKMNLEIDFLANRSRAPKDFNVLWPVEPTLYKGRMEFQGDTLIQTEMVRFNMPGMIRRELKIRFAPDFSSCSIAGFLQPSTHGDRKFDKQILCRVYGPK
jgi:hypothetical protein